MRVCTGTCHACSGPAVFQDEFYVVSVSPPFGEVGEGPDCHAPYAIALFGPIPAGIRGENLVVIITVALSAAGLWV